jgi:uncharacterized protein YdhG (YjbR/CyaY superfamily)
MTARNIDEYIATFPPGTRTILRKIRETIRKALPEAEEKISYRIPSFSLRGPRVYFAAFKSHIGLYPPVRDPKLREEAAVYAGEKGNLKFPLDKPIPYALIGRIAKAQAKESRKTKRNARNTTKRRGSS